jgi:hypothetical protein
MFSHPKPPHGIIINRINVYNSPIKNKEGEKFRISINAADTNGTIDSVYADLSGLNGNEKAIFTISNNNTYYIDYTLPDNIIADYYPITISIIDNDGNHFYYESGVFIKEAEFEPGDVMYTFLINLNKEGNVPPPWNNMSADPKNPVNKTGFYSTNGLEVPFAVQTSSSWGGYNNYGMQSGDNSGVFPDTVMQTYWWSDDEPAHLNIMGLPSEFNYTITTTGSRSGTDNRTSIFKVNNDSVIFNAAGNIHEKAVFENIEPDSAGAIRITLSKAKEAEYAYMNGLKLEFIAKEIIPIPDDTGYTNSVENTDAGNKKPFKIYPNPATDNITIISEQPINRVTIFNQQGISVIRKNGGPIQSVDVSTLSPGVYFISIEQDNQNSIKKIMIINHKFISP